MEKQNIKGYAIILLKCKKDTKSINSKVSKTTNGRIVNLLKCNGKGRFMIKIRRIIKQIRNKVSFE